MIASRNAYSAFKFTLTNPADAITSNLCVERRRQYALGWNAYTNEVFNVMAGWPDYAKKAHLYPRTKAIYNPVTRLVDFYGSHIYPGVLTTDGDNLPDGEILAIPLAKDTPDEIKEALGQLWQWSNWNINKDLWVVWCASMGDCPVEAVENVGRGKVRAKVIPPSHVIDFERDHDAPDNIISYVIEYKYFDRTDDQIYTYRKTVDRDNIREFRNDRPFDYGNGVAYDNPYGFAPLVWNSHRNIGTVPGATAVRSWRKVEMLNSLASEVSKYISVQSKTPTMVFGDGKVTSAFEDATKTDEDSITLLKMAGSGSVSSISGNLELAAAEVRIASMIAEIEHDHPEVTMYSQLRSMGQITGPAAELLMGDVKGNVTRARAGYDSASERLFKMLMTMGGMRANERKGGWANLTPQQEKFLPFNLESFERGDLEFSITSRPLLPKTNQQYWAEQDAKFTAIKKGIDAGFPMTYQEAQNGMNDDDVAALEAAQAKAQLQLMGDGFPRNIQ